MSTVAEFTIGIALAALILKSVWELLSGICRLSFGIGCMSIAMVLGMVGASIPKMTALCASMRMHQDFGRNTAFKNDLNSRLRNVAAHLKKVGSKAGFRTITSALSLCLVAGMIAIISGFSQDEPTKPTLPAERTLTDTTGRQIRGTVLEMSNGKIKFRRASDGKEFEIALDKLTRADIDWLNGVRPKHGMLNGRKTPEVPATERIRLANDESIEVYIVRIEAAGLVTLKNNQEIIIPFDDLSTYASAWAQGKDPAEIQAERSAKQLAALQKRRNEIAEMLIASRALEHEITLLSAADAREVFLKPEPKFAPFIKTMEYHWDSSVSKIICQWQEVPSHPDADRFHIDPRTILPQLDLDTEILNEKVSLRKEFEKFGIKPVPQEKLLSCELHAGHKLTNYLLSKKGLPKIGMNEFFEAGMKAYPGLAAFLDGKHLGGSRGISPFQVIGIVELYTKETPKVTNVFMKNRNLSKEMTKHLLRQGKPMFMDVRSNIPQMNTHVVVLTGFETINGKTRWECLDSHYYMMDEIGPQGDRSICIWYE